MLMSLRRIVPILSLRWITSEQIRNRRDKSLPSSGYKLRFKSLAVDEVYEMRTIDYTYDASSRLIKADYDNGTTIYTHGFDLAGNLTNLNGVSRT